MARGEWSFIHETVIYQYLMERFSVNNLKLMQICYDGKFKEKEVKVSYLEEITNTRFPDVDEIIIKSDKKGKRPAEVKFLTSQFDYHKNKKYKKDYNDFFNSNGFILVYKHDIIPSGLDIDKTDIYQLVQSDFINFVKENFERLFYQQVKEKKDRNAWLIYCGRESNFRREYNDGVYNIKAAIKSNIWCPTKNISPNEMTVGDKIIFIKTKGIGQKELQAQYEVRLDEWYIDEIHICEVQSPIMSREEYCRRNNMDSNQFLWWSEAKNNKKKYKYIFKFNIKSSYENLDMPIKKLREIMPEFVDFKIKEVFLRGYDKNININDYIDFLEYVSQYNYNKLMEKQNLYIENTYNNNYIYLS